VATANPITNDITVLLNQGDGLFWVDVTWTYPVGSLPRSIAAADLDGDGLLDLAVANSGSGDVSVLLNQTDGTFRDAVSYPSQIIQSTYWFPYLSSADFNGDGRTDLAILSNPCMVAFLINQGRGTFKDPVTHSLPYWTDFLIAADLNGDMKTDLAAIGSGASVLFNRTTSPASLDLNLNGVPDECDRPTFHRGDPNNDGKSDLSDGVAIFEFLFLGANEPGCTESADANNDGTIDISDGIFLLSYLFLGGPPPAAPGPPGTPCGLDPDAPGSAGDLGCDSYKACR
jgi:hypothetical protein